MTKLNINRNNFFVLIEFFNLLILLISVYYNKTFLMLLSIGLSFPLMFIESRLVFIFLILTGVIYYVSIFPGVSLFRIYAIISIFALLLHERFSIKKSVMLWILVFFSLFFISMFGAYDLKFSLSGLSSMFLNLIIFILLVNLPLSDEKFWNEIVLYVFSVFIIFVAICLYRKGVYTSTGRLTLEGVNPNALAIGIAQAVGFVSYYLFVYKRSFIKILAVIIVTIGFSILIMIGSRSSLLGAYIGINIGLFISIKNKAKLLKFFYMFFPNFYIVLIFFLATHLDPRILWRFDIVNIITTQASHRTVIWKYLFEVVIPQHLLFGVGIGGENVAFALNELGLPPLYQRPAHNLFIDILTQIGIIGLIVFAVFFIDTFMRGIRKLNKYPTLHPFFIIFISSLSIGIGETVFYNKIFWISISMIWRYFFVNDNIDT